MADNTTLPGTGEVIEDIDTGSAKRQVVALGDRAGTTNDPLGGVGDSAWASGNGGIIALLKTIATWCLAPFVRTTTSVIQVTDSWTRPANTTTYAAGDEMSNAASSPAQRSWANTVASAGKSFWIGTVTIFMGSNQTLPAAGRIWLFNDTPTMGNDNAAFAVSDADMAKVIDVIPFVMSNVGTVTSGASGSLIVTVPVDRLTVLVGTSLYYRLEIDNAYVPISGDAVAATVIGERVD